MRMTKRATMLALAAVVVGACGGTAPAGAGGAGGMGGAGGAGGMAGAGGEVGRPPPTFTIDVTSADRPYAIAGATASSGHFFVALVVDINNVSASSPVRASASLFSIKTSAETMVPPARVGIDGECGEQSLAPKEGLWCDLAFEVPMGEAAVQLHYADGSSGRSAWASIPPLPAIACDSIAGWKHASDSSCVSCLQSDSKSCPSSSGCSEAEVACVDSELQKTTPLSCSDVTLACALSDACRWRAQRDCLAVRCDSACK